jgi:hypothetical protein
MPRAVTRARSLGPDPGRWIAAAVRSAEQSLDDLAETGAAEVVFVRHARQSSPLAYVDALTEAALALGFAVARVQVLAECAFDTLASVVEAAVHGLRVAGLGRRSGLVALLDAFAEKRGGKALAELRARLEASDLGGDLGRLAQSYLAAKTAPKVERARIEAWLSGVELARVAGEDAAVHALSARTAKRALGDVTRLVRALGHRGTLLVLHGAESVAALPPARRHAAYTVLRELVDNADGGRGMASAALHVVGSTALFAGPRSLASLAPLAQRLGDTAGPAEAPRPHQPLIDLDRLGPLPASVPDLRRAPRSGHAALRAIVRASHGLPPIERVASTSVGHQAIERSIDALFEHSRADGSVFALLTGGYGAGKTHFLLHLAARALADRRPVLRLSLERLDLDLGHPERHLRRLLDHASLPGATPDLPDAPLDLLARWTATGDAVAEMVGTLGAIADTEGEAADAARRALGVARRAPSPGLALAAHLGAADLVERAVSVSARRDAYGRLLLWLELLERRAGAVGPVLLIDEAENLYRGGVTQAERRTALRSLSFYCGGALPRACVVLAITPEALATLQEEAPELLGEVAQQKSVLAWEDATMLCRRLERARPLDVPSFGEHECRELARRLAAVHLEARGPAGAAGRAGPLASVWRPAITPREATLRIVDQLERGFWSSGSP